MSVRFFALNNEVEYNTIASMYLKVLLLFPLTFITLPTLAALITFSNFARPHGSPIVTQSCSTLPDPDVCCVPLDLNINDGRHYGWFQALQVAFSWMDDPDTFAAVYARGASRPCFGEMVDHRLGHEDWWTQYLPLVGAGSALLSTSMRPITYTTRWPFHIFVGSVGYAFVSRSADGIFEYKSPSGRYIRGRMMGRLSLLDQAKGNASFLLPATRGNSTVMADVA